MENKNNINIEEMKNLALEIYKKSNDAIVITDENIKIIDINYAFSEISGYSKDEVIGKNPSLLQSKWHDEEFYKSLWESVEKRGFWEGNIKDRRKNGELYISKAYLFKAHKDGKVYYLGISKDITSHFEDHEKIKKLAFYDCLTDLPNRLFFEENLQNIIKESQRYNKKFALLFIDLDNFKLVNDTFGHLMGDKLLSEVANRLKSNVRDSDVCARFAGDEFTLILRDINNPTVIANIANKIIEHLKEPYLIDEHEFSIGSSVGIAIYPQDGEDYKSIVKNADVAMYTSKNNGKNRFTFYCPNMNDDVIKKFQIENYMKESLRDDKFFIEYQSLLSTSDTKIVSYEALVRWEHPNLGILYPNSFIPLCEENGLIIKLGTWIIDRVFKDIVSMREKQKEIKVSINISAKQLSDKNFSKYILKKIDEYSINTKQIVFEITETILLVDSISVKNNINTLKEIGISFSLDDFGTGYSSLTYIKNFPIDTIKIDKDFISSMLEDENNMAIVESILYLSKLLGKNVVAEGIESIEQFNHLKEKECGAVQGFYFSKPKRIELID